MEYEIIGDDEFNTVFAEGNERKSIIQNIAMLCSTRKGTVPQHRDFGLPMEFIDKPVEIAENIAATEISEGIEKFEPRAALKSVSFKSSSEGKIIIQLEVTANV